MGWRIGFQLCTPTATPPLAGWLEGVWTHRADAVSVRGQARQFRAPDALGPPSAPGLCKARAMHLGYSGGVSGSGCPALTRATAWAKRF